MRHIKFDLELFLSEIFKGNRQELATHVNISEGMISKLANGHARPGIGTVSRVINYCNANQLDYRRYINF